MSQQFDLFTQRLITPSYDKDESIQARFEKFDAANPWVYQALLTLASRAMNQGRKRIGIKHLFEVVRWQYAANTSGEEFKLNNNFTSRYARKMIAARPALAPLFEVRELRAA